MKDFDVVPGKIHRGLGIIARWPGMVLVIPSDTAHDQAVDDMIAELGENAVPNSVASQVKELISAPGGVLRSAAYVTSDGEAMTLMAYGPMEILADGSVVADGRSGPEEFRLDGEVNRLTVRASNLSRAAEPVAPFDLRRGVVPGAGITLSGTRQFTETASVPPPRRAPSPAATAPRSPAGVRPDQNTKPSPSTPLSAPPLSPHPSPAPAHSPNPMAPQVNGSGHPNPISPNGAPHPRPAPAGADPAPRFDAVQIDPGTNVGAQQTPLPTAAGNRSRPNTPSPVAAPHRTADGGPDSVEGIICAGGHFNNPSASFCSVCGAPLSSGSVEMRSRPNLGFIVFDDGATYDLDRGYLVGREPETPSGSGLDPLIIQDNNETLSRTHAEIRLNSWSVELIDLNSTNGSFVWDSDFERWSRIPASQPRVLAPGETIALGRRTFVYESVVEV